MGYFESCKWREVKTPCKRAACLPDWNTRLCLKIPGFGETNGLCAMRGGNPRGSAIISRFLRKIADRSCNIKGTKRTAVPCLEQL